MKNWFSNCFPLYICLHCEEVCICWHFGTPGFNVRAQHDPEELIFILTQKFLIRLLLYLTCKLLINRGYMWTKMGPVWLFKHIYIKCLWVLLTNVYWFRVTGGYICGCGGPSNLVCLKVIAFAGRCTQSGTPQWRSIKKIHDLGNRLKCRSRSKQNREVHIYIMWVLPYMHDNLLKSRSFCWALHTKWYKICEDRWRKSMLNMTLGTG